MLIKRLKLPVIASIVFCTLVFLFWKNIKTSEFYLWDKNWLVIEYSMTPSLQRWHRLLRKSKILAPDSYVSQTSPYPLKDEHDVDLSLSGYETREKVREIFQTWRRPAYLSYYKLPSSFNLATTSNLARIFLYRGAESSPVELRLIRKLSKDRMLLHSSLEPELLFVVPIYFWNILDRPLYEFRSRDVFSLEGQGSIQRISVIDHRAQPSVTMEFFSTEQVTSGQAVWNVSQNDKNPRALSSDISQRLQRSLSEVKVAFFADEAITSAYPSISDLWSRNSKTVLYIRIEFHGGNFSEIYFRRPLLEGHKLATTNTLPSLDQLFLVEKKSTLYWIGKITLQSFFRVITAVQRDTHYEK